MGINATTFPGWQIKSITIRKVQNPVFAFVKKAPEEQKLPLIPPIFHKFVTDLKKKLNFSIHSLQNSVL